MKLVFLCSSLEPGRDGVGDYTLRLAAELVKLGHECLCIATNDKKLDTKAHASSEEEATESGVRVLRFSSCRSWEERLPLLRNAVQRFGPDWISLQYVPWGYDPKGLPRQLAGRLSAVIDNCPLHIMCHELWMEGPWFSIKHRILGALQKLLYWNLFRVLRPQVVHTQTPLYRKMLRSIGVQSEIFPLHGSIALPSSRAAAQMWLSERIGSSPGEPCFGFFGEIHSSLDRDKLAALAKECSGQTGVAWILSGGILTAGGLAAWNELKQHFSDKTKFVLLGRMEEWEVSNYLSALTMGLSSYPPEFVAKSSSVAAMLEHGLSVRLLGRSVRNAADAREDCLFARDATSAHDAAKRLAETLAP